MCCKRWLLIFLLFYSVPAFCQPEEFYAGLKLMSKDELAAKASFQLAIKKDSTYHGSYHYLGVICLEKHQLDSAAWYFSRALILNKNNDRHTKEFTYLRIIDTYLQKLDFAKACKFAYQAYQVYPKNPEFGIALKDVCLWSVYIKYDGLNPAYILPDLKTEYVVNSVAQEYLILRKIRVDGEYLMVTSQSYFKKDTSAYDQFDCHLSKSKKKITVDFKLNWKVDIGNSGGTPPDIDGLANDKARPVYERIGAMLIDDEQKDLRVAVKEVME